jgi:hypothetical protein
MKVHEPCRWTVQEARSCKTGIAAAFLANALGGEAERDWVAEWNAIYSSLFGPAIEAAKKTYAHQPAERSRSSSGPGST